MINWDEFEHIHVIRKLKEVIAKWFAVDIFFADDRGNLNLLERGQKKEFANPVMNLLLQREPGYDQLSEYIRSVVTELRRTQEKDYIKDFQPNLVGSSFPILIDNDFMGAVCAIGYYHEQVNEGQQKEEIYYESKQCYGSFVSS